MSTATVTTPTPSTPPHVEPEVSLERDSDTDTDSILVATTEYPDLSILSGPVFKDARAAAHDKQRSKKAGDRAKGRGSKHSVLKPSGLHAHGHGHNMNGDLKAEERKYAALGEREREVEADWLTLRKGADGDLDAVDVSVPSSRCTCGRGHRGEGKGEGGKTEVRLLDLVRPAKRRGGIRGKCFLFNLITLRSTLSFIVPFAHAQYGIVVLPLV